ncbi:MAG: prepilin-type N-terminal cleavage/methylation domain-containing protein, partial [Fusobacterium sp.]|nr:prepilin-type N-terminal cleavage/methylation domain-containing protein [Fusobacterium sp.]
AEQAFTMAEILLSLTIIGVVAAITLPSLTGNINERTWNTQRKALFARLSQAVPLMGSISGYADTETFITGGLSKVLKINNICDNEHIEDCGLASSLNTLDNKRFALPTKMSELNEYMISVSYLNSGTGYSHTYSQTDTLAAAFETANGESVLAFYYPNCRSKGTALMNDSLKSEFAPPLLCANFVYDLNGSKGPNTMGKDIGFISVLYPTDSVVVAPIPYIRDVALTQKQEKAAPECTKLDSEYRLPNLEELIAIFVNQKFLASGGSENILQNIYWSSTLNSDDVTRGWGLNFGSAAIAPYLREQGYKIRCVKR